MKTNILLILFLSAFAPIQAQIPFSDLPDSLQVDLDTKYAVHWPVTFTPVVSQDSATIDLLEPMFNAVELISKSDNYQLANNSLLCEKGNCTIEQVATVSEYMYHTPLPALFEWFLGIQSDDTLIFGIKDTSDTFEANVAEAIVSIEQAYSNTPAVCFRLDNGEATEITKAFKDFTERNLFKAVATEINGLFVMAPRLNTSIESGAIVVSSMPIPLINKLFHPDPEIEEELIIDE